MFSDVSDAMFHRLGDREMLADLETYRRFLVFVIDDELSTADHPNVRNLGMRVPLCL